MTAKLRSWIIAGIIVLLIGFIVVWWFNGTGFGRYDKVTEEYTPTGQLTKTTKESQPGKTVWDWLNLLGVLAIPIVVGFGAAWFTAQQGKLSEQENKDNQYETVLQAYIDKISELLLKEHLSDLTVDGKLKLEYDQVREIARVRTINVLTRLNGRRIGFVFAFLREAGLMSTTSDNSVVSLENAELRAVKWSQANLEGTNLRYVNLFEADLSGANLSGANLSGAYLREANLSQANLNAANLNAANLSQANLSQANLKGTDLRKANLFEANLSKTDLQEAIGLTDEQRADYRSRGAIVDPIPSTPPSSMSQRNEEQVQSPTPAQVAVPLSSASDTMPSMQKDDADTNSSSAVHPNQPETPS